MLTFKGFLAAYVRLAGVDGLVSQIVCTLLHALFPRRDGEFLVDRAILGLSGMVIGLILQYCKWRSSARSYAARRCQSTRGSCGGGCAPPAAPPGPVALVDVGPRLPTFLL